jgi:membrane protease YdiL (CAAX protease family)
MEPTDHSSRISETATGESLRATRRWHGMVLVALELAVLAGIYVADWTHHIYFSKIPYLFALAWLSLRVRGLHWRDVGFVLYRNWTTTVVLGVLAGVGIEAMELFWTQPSLARVFHEMPDLSDFNRVQGNIKWLAGSLLLTWTLFAFGEELVFRGYLMNRVAGLFASPRAGWTVALVLANLVFGLSHFHQGPTGIVENFLDGMLLGALYLGCGRCLAVPIGAHAVTDTIDFLLIFLHRYPGMHF